jgi:hypothetical protein
LNENDVQVTSGLPISIASIGLSELLHLHLEEVKVRKHLSKAEIGIILTPLGQAV